jgi:hypothetical protein
MRTSLRGGVIAAALAATLPGLVATGPALAGAAPRQATAPRQAPAPRQATAAGCSAGAHTLAPVGSHVYPETGNGGYTSEHTDVHMVYDAVSNRFLPGNHVVLQDLATQCLTSFSLDLERRSTANVAIGPDLTVHRVQVNGKPASFRFVQPTFPGDPRGQNDPRPAAHEASENRVVGGPRHNPLAPACEPELRSESFARRNSQNGEECPATKLLITPSAPLPSGSVFTVTVWYTGRPGVHTDGDGTTEGWFRSDKPAGDGGFVTTEPVGTEDWMPLNDFPSAKPTYDFYDTVTAGRTVLANGILMSHHANPPSKLFPHGSASWHWHMSGRVASYLVENSVGHYDLTKRIVDGRPFYEAQASSLSPKRKAKNLKIMSMQPDITAFEATFNGPFPFASDGVVVGRPSASFEEEMATMITFAGGEIDTDTLYHENMHQWWGDHVTEADYHLTFFKEGLATLGEFLFQSRKAAQAAGGLGAAAGQKAFEAKLLQEFRAFYLTKGKNFWRHAPSDPTAYLLFGGNNTYLRPGISYIALRQILGADRFSQALAHLQQQYGGGSITEPQLEAGFAAWLPSQSAGCQARLGQFFRQWWDTAYPPGGGKNKPLITGPGLPGQNFYGHGGCIR